ncbi:MULTISPECIES: DUF4365 domain-containing protein [Nocardia]|uniref:DUF4365 domain-containing protein n=2 Tax=Nocardiaceae TaxID=85025 RepID=UPI000FDC2204|nr:MULTISPECIES: DUF4365 domain-containing protein [Nocardia]MBF6185130.1 DUF4365 domain-containing protein [Nocardia farcinica]MBF6407585.1 DUF4365 domain-containing protein [Nocardia farcinica]UEX21729.1 DUF4365 domain-containing protein [Nocardia farcinica]
MRANARKKYGAAGESAVKSHFEKLGWGAIPNPEHDLGTDLWLMPRDDRDFDCSLFCGAQVKTSPDATRRTKYFKQPGENGGLPGWWYYEEDQDHFKFWIEHAEPHFIVLHNLAANTSYWSLVTGESVEWTPKGGKIFVPSTQLLDESGRDLLLAAAATQRGPVGWEGSAWTGAGNLAPADSLRYALLAPRLVAPHPNNQPDRVAAPQAIAALVLGRTIEFTEPPGSLNPYPCIGEITESSEWALRLLAALYGAVTTGHLEKLFEFVAQPAPSVHESVTAAVVGAAFHFETGDVGAAIILLDRQIERNQADVVDHAWLLVQRARAARELGESEAAVALATAAFRVRFAAPADPTGLAISAIASQIVLALTPSSPAALSEAVIASDTAVAWWRSQLVGQGLDDVLESGFKSWTADGSVTLGSGNSARHLRAASLISGFTGDHAGWRRALSMWCRTTLLADDGDDTELALMALNDLRVCGDADDVRRAAQRFLRAGPVDAVAECASSFSLRECTRSTMPASVALIVSGADVFTEPVAEAHAQVAMEWFRDPVKILAMMGPGYSLAALQRSMLDVVRATTPVVSDRFLRDVVDFLVEVAHQALFEHVSTCLIWALRRVPIRSWTDGDIADLRAASTGNEVLRKAVDQLFSGGIPAREAELMAAAETGDPDAISALPDISRITPAAAAALVPALRARILGQIDACRRGEWSGALHEDGFALTVINMYQPERADWTPIVALLDSPSSLTDDVFKTLLKIRSEPELIPPEVQSRLVEAMHRWVKKLDARSVHTGDLHGSLLETLKVLSPESVAETELWTLMSGSREQRQSLARILRRRKSEKDIGVLLGLAYDHDVMVRGTAAECLAALAGEGHAHPDTVDATQTLAIEPGTQVALRITCGLAPYPDTAIASAIAARLVEHPSSQVRRWAHRVLVATPPLRRR